MLAAQAVGKALREREQALLTVSALENELRAKRRGISSLEDSGQQVGAPCTHTSTYLSGPKLAICLVRGSGMDAIEEEALRAASAAAWSLLSTLASCCSRCNNMHAVIVRQQQACMTRVMAHLPGGPAFSCYCMLHDVATGLLEASALAQSGGMRPHAMVLCLWREILRCCRCLAGTRGRRGACTTCRRMWRPWKPPWKLPRPSMTRLWTATSRYVRLQSIHKVLGCCVKRHSCAACCLDAARLLRVVSINPSPGCLNMSHAGTYWVQCMMAACLQRRPQPALLPDEVQHGRRDSLCISDLKVASYNA